MLSTTQVRKDVKDLCRAESPDFVVCQQLSWLRPVILR